MDDDQDADGGRGVAGDRESIRAGDQAASDEDRGVPGDLPTGDGRGQGIERACVGDRAAGAAEGVEESRQRTEVPLAADRRGGEEADSVLQATDTEIGWRPIKPLLIGEQNPYGEDPHFALFPRPAGCSGARLKEILGFQWDKQYLDTFERVNLCNGPWELLVAREHAKEIMARWEGPVVLLGAKVCQAFEFPYEPFSLQKSLPGLGKDIYILPHPSGRCRAWNDPKSVERARELLREFL